MDLLHRMRGNFAAKARARETVRALSHLDDRQLADLGLSRDDVPRAARIAARAEPGEIGITDLVRRLRQAEEPSGAAPKELPRTASAPAMSRRDLDRHVRQARRMRAEAQAEILRSAARVLARVGGGAARPLVAGAASLPLAESARLALVWRREFRKARAELEAYSERELTSDLRLNRSEIPRVAAEAADARVAAVARARPERGTVAWALGGRPGYAGHH